MKLTDMQRSKSRRPVYSTALSDRSGNESYELSVVGPSKLVGQVFEKCDFEIQIDVDVATDAYEKSSKEFFNKHLQADHLGHPEAEVMAGLIGGKLPGPSSTNDTVIVYLRRTKGDGTFWAMFFPFLVVPPGASLFFVLPRVWATFGMVVPITGNPDIFLSLGAPFAPFVSTGFGPGVNTASFIGPPIPWAQFSAWHRIFGAAPATSTTNFLMTGHSIPWF